jgi:predicted CoA-binding protein
MQNTIKAMLEKKRWAVVGAHPNPQKFGNKIYKKLREHQYEVIPVNPVYESVEGVNTVKSLMDIEGTVDCVNVVVSPKRAMQVVKDAVHLGIKYIWFQPGAFDEAVIDLAESSGLEVVFHACVLVELDR